MAKVMIVDDSTLILTMVGQCVSALGHTVIQLIDGDHLDANLDYWGPDLIILDYFLPRQTGRELFKVIRTHPGGEKVPILFLTAKPIQEVRLAVSDSRTRFLQKPMDLGQLSQAVTEALNMRD